MNILSLFDGMSCGQIALNRAVIKYENYYASEIENIPIKVTQHHFPNTIQLGDVTKINAINLPKIDLLIGGSPCQGFSFAGKQLNFNDPRSKLFFEFVRLLKECKPKYFLLENVKMKKEYENIISEHLGVQPMKINSNLVSAQNRIRNYWTNIPGINQPENKNISLKSILELDVFEKDKSYYLNDASIKKEGLEKYHKQDIRQVVFTERRTEEAKAIRREYQKIGKDFSPRRGKELVPRKDDKCNCLTTSLSKEHILIDEIGEFRKLTELECERLQTVDDNYTKIAGNKTQRIKMLGNGWTIDVISHIFKEIKET
jgi:DNA (cytosine-5)-methyltransferase 3A